MQLICPGCRGAYAADQAGGLCPRCLAGMALQATDTPADELPLDPGQSFHGLRVLSLVARGGMGVVYRARQTPPDRDVALKILPRSLAAEEEFRLRFDREARALAGLSHPHIVNLFDFGVDGDLMFLVMEFVEGVSLRELLRKNKLTPARAVTIALEICDALQFAHREGIIHRDIKPDNVLIDRAGRVKLTDFGLAKRVSADATQLTQTNLAVGTPHYMAPEQLEQPKGIDHRVDIYSLGVVLYEMLTRELPIGRFPPPSQRAEVDGRMDDLVYRCLEKNPEQRYSQVADLRIALSRAASGLKGARGPMLPEEPIPPVRPRIASNLEVRCPCGSQFYVPAAARGLVHCPACGEPVTLTEPVPGTRRAAAPPGPSFRLNAPLKLLLAAISLVLLVGVLFTLVLSPSAARRVPEEAAYRPKAPAPGPAALDLSHPAPSLPAPSATLPAPAPGTSAAPARPVPESARASELRTQLDRALSQSNLAGIVATILLYSGRPADFQQMQSRIGQFDGDIQDLLRHLGDQGIVVNGPDRFRSGDKIASFGGRKVDIGQTLAFADQLRAWLRAFQPGVTEEVEVLRNRARVSLQFQFADRTPELVELARQVGVVLGETPGYLPPSPEGRPSRSAPLPVELLTRIKERQAALPAFYRESLPYDDRGRAEALLLAAQGNSDDSRFLTGRYCDLLARCEAELKGFASKVKDLEARMSQPGPSLDTIYFKDGRKVEGSILEQAGDTLKIKGRFGSITESQANVLRIEHGTGVNSDFKARYQAAQGRKTELLMLLAQVRDRNIPEQKDLVAYAVLLTDPGDERCRMELGLGRSPFATGPAVDSSAPADRIEYHGRIYSSDQLRQELKSLGYVLVNGVWCEKVPRSLRVDNLYRDDTKLPATYFGTSVQSQLHTEKDTVYDYRQRAWIPRTKQVSVARYIGGSGTCTIEITAPGDIVECRIHARAQVARVGGSVIASVICDSKDNGGKVLYAIMAPGENDASHDVTETVFGHARFYLRVDIKGEGGMFLPSDSNDLGVLEVKYSYGKPLERVNALLQPKIDVLPGDPPPAAPPVPGVVEAGCRNVAAAAARNETLSDALADVRRLTEDLRYPRDYAMPSKFSAVASQLKDPLVPDWNSLSREQVLKLRTWWDELSSEDRRDFLQAYGLWCARSRYLRYSR